MIAIISLRSIDKASCNLYSRPPLNDFRRGEVLIDKIPITLNGQVTASLEEHATIKSIEIYTIQLV